MCTKDWLSVSRGLARNIVRVTVCSLAVDQGQGKETNKYIFRSGFVSEVYWCICNCLLSLLLLCTT